MTEGGKEKAARPTERPVLRKLSYGQARQLGYQRIRTARLIERLDASMSDEDFEATVAAIETSLKDTAKLIAPLIVSMPRSWLVEDAPTSIDWSQPESLDYLAQAQYDELIALVTSAPDAAKN